MGNYEKRLKRVQDAMYGYTRALYNALLKYGSYK